MNAAIGLLGMLLMGGSGLIIPKRDVFVSGISQLLAMAGSNEALRYVSYPTQVKDEQRSAIICRGSAEKCDSCATDLPRPSEI